MNKSAVSKMIRHQSEERKRRQSIAAVFKWQQQQQQQTMLLFGLILGVALTITTIHNNIQSVDAHTLHSDTSIQGDHQQSTNGNGRLQKAMASGSSAASGGNQNRCQSGWMWFNNKCWVTTQSRRDFIHAVDLCKKMYNSTLPTIHSDEENEFLRQNIELTNSPIWLYARHNHQYNRTRWLDKTAVNYTRWDAGQPSDKSSLVCIKTEDNWYMKKAEPVDGQTECVSFWEDAKWGTQVGCQVLLPVVCEKKLTPISRFSSQDGPNGTVTSQYEQQQMYNPVSGSTSYSNNLIHAMYALTLAATTSIGFISSPSSSIESLALFGGRTIIG